MQEFQLKVDQIRELLKKKFVKGVSISQQKNFSWLTSGRGFVNQATERAVGTIVITLDSTCIIANNIEAVRLMEEEVQAEFDQVEVFPWHEPTQLNEIISRLAGDERFVWDTELETDFIAFRTILTGREKERVRRLAQDTAQALEQTAFEIQRGETEFHIASRLAAHCLERGIEPIVNLVAADLRVFSRRHPLPTSQRLDNYAMLVIGGRRQGQIVSASRLVHFGQPSEDLLERHKAVATVDAAMISHTVYGTRFSDIFAYMKEAYKAVGFAEEWKYHHQGGLSGYLSREQLLLPDVSLQVQQDQVYAWNPSIAGVKSEDTILITGQGQEILTYTGQYPMVEVEWNGKKIERPGILIR